MVIFHVLASGKHLKLVAPQRLTSSSWDQRPTSSVRSPGVRKNIPIHSDSLIHWRSKSRCYVVWMFFGDLNGRCFLVGGFSPTPLKNDGVKVSWDDYSIPNIWKVIIHSMVPVTTKQFFMFPGFCTWRWHKKTVGLRGSSHHTQLDPVSTSKHRILNPWSPWVLAIFRGFAPNGLRNLFSLGGFLGVGFSLFLTPNGWCFQRSFKGFTATFWTKNMDEPGSAIAWCPEFLRLRTGFLVKFPSCRAFFQTSLTMATTKKRGMSPADWLIYISGDPLGLDVSDLFGFGTREGHIAWMLSQWTAYDTMSDGDSTGLWWQKQCHIPSSTINGW